MAQRIRTWRMYRGMTQEQCAGLVGRSLSWWEKVERGVVHVEKLSDLVHIARVLRIRHLEDLTGSLDIALARDRAREHPILPALRAAVEQSTAPPTDTPVDAVPLDELRSTLDRYWGDWRAASIQPRSAETVPALLRAAVATRYAATDPAERRRASALLAETYILTAMCQRWVSDFIAAETTMHLARAAARDADDPITMALAAWQLAGVLKDVGRPEDALTMCLDGADVVAPLRTDDVESDDAWAVWGHLQLQAGLSAGHCGDEGTAMRHWDAGEDVARRYPGPYVVGSFGGRECAGEFLVRTYTALGKSSAAITAADRLDIPAMHGAISRALTLIDVARGYAARGRSEDVATLHTLQLAERESPDIVAHNVYVHDLVRVMLLRDRRTISPEVRAMASRIGVLD